MKIPVGIPVGVGMAWVWDFDESSWVCGDSVGIFGM